MKKLFKDPSLWILFAIIVVAIILRFSYLNRVPAGISDDELDTVLTSRSVYYTGKTLEGIFSPFSFKSVPPNALVPYARAPYMLLAPFTGLFQRGLAEVKLPFAIINVLTTMVLICISWILWGKRIAIYTAFVFSFNPWSIYFGRTAFDTPISIFFIYIFLLCILSLRNWWLLLAFIPWFVGLYSYQGMIIVYPLILVIGVIGIWKIRGHVYGRPYLALVALGVITFFSFMVAFRDDRAGTRMNEITTPNNPIIIARVDNQRRKSVQTPINSIALNKFTVAGWQMLGQYIGAFSTEHLFVSGEQRSTFSVWSHGLFYSFEFVLLLIGLYTAYRINRNKTRFLIALIFIAPIPATISSVGVSYALRASFMYPIFCLFIAIGLATVCSIRRYNGLIKIGFVILYVIVITNFLHIYFIQNPVNNSEGFGFSNRLLAKYMRLASDQKMDVLYVGSNVVNSYRQYIFYNNILSSRTIESVQLSIGSRAFHIDNIQFLECPQQIPDEKGNKKICAALTKLTNSFDPIVVANLGDSGRIYEIYNDKLCSKYSLMEYQPMITFNDLEIEKMPAESFCKTYISKPKPNPTSIKLDNL